MKKDLGLYFMNYSEACDKVRHEEIFKMFRKLDIDGKDLTILKVNSSTIRRR